MRVCPARGQLFAGLELQVVFPEFLGVLQLFAVVQASHDCLVKRVEQILQAQYFDQVTIVFFLQKHR